MVSIPTKGTGPNISRYVGKIELEGDVGKFEAGRHGFGPLALGADPTGSRNGDKGARAVVTAADAAPVDVMVRGCVGNSNAGKGDIFLPSGMVPEDGQALLVDGNVQIDHLSKEGIVALVVVVVVYPEKGVGGIILGREPFLQRNRFRVDVWGAAGWRGGVSVLAFWMLAAVKVVVPIVAGKTRVERSVGTVRRQDHRVHRRPHGIEEGHGILAADAEGEVLALVKARASAAGIISRPRWAAARTPIDELI